MNENTHTHTHPECMITADAWTDTKSESFPASLPAASSTTGPDHLKQDKDSSATDASSWSVDDVIRFVQEADPQTLGPHIDLFRKHVSTVGCIVTRSHVAYTPVWHSHSNIYSSCVKDARLSCPCLYFSGGKYSGIFPV